MPHQEKLETADTAAASRAGRAPDQPDLSSNFETLDPTLIELFEDLAGRIEAGEPVDADHVAAEHPAWADEIRALLPTLLRKIGVSSFLRRRK